MLNSESLTSTQIEKLLNWQGYGNPAGQFWFIGMEEGGSPPTKELAARADLWEPVEDLALAPRPWEHNLNLEKSITSVWDGMCKIVGRISGAPDWNENSFVRKYQSEQLGRREGETFLTEVLPLPKRRAHEWPYESLWPTREQYEEEIRPERLQMLRSLYEQWKPALTFCYGIANWRNNPYYQQIFAGRRFSSLVQGESLISVNLDSTVVMMRHFGDWHFTTDRFETLLDTLGKVLRQREFPIQFE